MSLLAASPLLSSLFLTYANKAAALDGPSAPSPIDLEWTEMKALNNRLQEEVASLRAQLAKEADRAKAAEDCVEALRAQLSSVKDANCNLEITVSDGRDRLEATTTEYAGYKKEMADTIAELRSTMDAGTVSRADFQSKIKHLTLRQQCSRAALSQVIADQQVALTQLKEKSDCFCSTQTAPKDCRDVHERKPDQKDDIKQLEDSKPKEKENSWAHWGQKGSSQWGQKGNSWPQKGSSWTQKEISSLKGQGSKPSDESPSN